MITYAAKNDFEEIFSLWKQCFFDSDRFNNWYFKNIFKIENTLVFKNSTGRICAMLQNIPYKFKNIGDVSYIYGACTTKDMRNKGLMRDIISFAFEEDKKNNKKASVLIPQNKELFEFYAKFGYKPTMLIEKIVAEKTNVYYNVNNIEIVKADFSDIQQIDNIYNTFWDKFYKNKNFDYVLRDFDYWKNQIKMFESMGGSVYCVKEQQIVKAYSFVWYEDEIFVQELVGVSDYYENIITDEIINIYGTQNIFVNKFRLGGKCLSKGCIKIYDEKLSEQNKDYFFNLMYD